MVIYGQRYPRHKWRGSHTASVADVALGADTPKLCAPFKPQYWRGFPMFCSAGADFSEVYAYFFMCVSVFNLTNLFIYHPSYKPLYSKKRV